jgi:hypothetical protein
MTPLFGDPSGGEQIDRAARDSIRLAHKALERFPELVRKHKFIAGGAAISSSLIVLAGVAIARRILAGQTPDEAVATVTEDEVQGLRVIEPTSADSPESLDSADSPESAESETAVAEVDLQEAAGNGEAEDLPAAPTPAFLRRANGA